MSPRSVIHEIVAPLGFTHAQEQDILRATTGEPGRIFSAKQWRLLIDRGHIIIAPIPTEESNIEQKYRFASHTGCLIVKGLGKINYNIVDKMQGPFTIRSVQQGDSFTPFGLKGTKLLSDFMTDIKLNRFEKESQKVMCDGNQIAWVIGERSSDIFRVDTTTKKVLILELIKE